MANVRLIHPIEITIEPIDTSDTVYDPDTGEALHLIGRKTTIVIKGQIRWYVKDRLTNDRAGVSLNASGHIVILRKDAVAKSYVPRPGDRIIKTANDTVNLYVVGVDPLAHYVEPKCHKLIINDKQPSRD